MGVFCDRIKFGSTAALDCHTGQNKGRYIAKNCYHLIGYKPQYVMAACS